MKTLQILTSLLLASMTLMASGSRAASPFEETGEWSRAVNGLQARLTLIGKGERYGTRWLVPYIELRNVRNLLNQMEVNCDWRHLKIELVDADGKPLRHGWATSSRTGLAAELSTVILPRDSTIRISLENTNYGIPRNAAAMVSTDSGAWVIEERERGRVFLRATLTGEQSNPPWKSWSGTLQTPLQKVDWE